MGRVKMTFEPLEGDSIIQNEEVLTEQKNKIIDILRTCCDNTDERLNKNKLNNVYMIIKEYIEHDKQRFLYSVVSNYIYTLNDQTEDTLQNFLEDLVAYVEQDHNRKTSNTGKAIIKLWDHINLALAQELYVQSNQGDIQSATVELENRIGYVSQETYSMQSKIDSLISQMISIVSIFTAISFVVFGGISSFQSIISNIENVSLSKMMIIGCIWGFAIINLLFMFIYYIAKLTGQSIKTNNTSNATLKQRYPLIVYIDSILFTIFIISVWIKLNEIIVGKEKLLSIIDNKILFMIIGSAILLVFLIILWVFIIYKRKEKKLDNTSEYD